MTKIRLHRKAILMSKKGIPSKKKRSSNMKKKINGTMQPKREPTMAEKILMQLKINNKLLFECKTLQFECLTSQNKLLDLFNQMIFASTLEQEKKNLEKMSKETPENEE